MWEVTKGRVTFSAVNKVKFAEKYFDPDIAARSSEGISSEQLTHERLMRGDGPKSVEALRLPALKRHRTMETQLHDGLVVAAQPDFTFIDSTNLRANIIEQKLREKPHMYDIVQAAVALLAASRDLLFRDYACEYYFYFFKSDILMRFDRRWYEENREAVETVCRCTARILSSQIHIDSKPVRRPNQKQQSKTGQMTLFAHDLKEEATLAVSFRSPFDESYDKLTKNYLNRLW